MFLATTNHAGWILNASTVGRLSNFIYCTVEWLPSIFYWRVHLLVEIIEILILDESVHVEDPNDSAKLEIGLDRYLLIINEKQGLCVLAVKLVNEFAFAEVALEPDSFSWQHDCEIALRHWVWNLVTDLVVDLTGRCLVVTNGSEHKHRTWLLIQTKVILSFQQRIELLLDQSLAPIRKNLVRFKGLLQVIQALEPGAFVIYFHF